jgi:hypothetical protein
MNPNHGHYLIALLTILVCLWALTVCVRWMDRGSDRQVRRTLRRLAKKF